MSFSVYLKRIREEKKINQTEMAEILDISRTAIKLIENGSTKYPSKKVLQNLVSFLNSTEIDVMTEILFDNQIDCVDGNELFVRHYLAYMYLEGWNIVEHPYVYPIWQGHCIEFDGKIIKKRQPKNIVIVTSYKKELFRITKVRNKMDALGYVSDFASKLMQVVDSYRGIKLVFDAESVEEQIAYNYISEIQINHNGFNIELVLYNKNIGVNRVGNI